MQELFRTNLYIADSDSVNTTYSINEYIKKFKSSLLMAKSVGMNPNMIFDSQGFEDVVKDETIKKFFVKKILELQKDGIEYTIKIHIFNNYIENNYFENGTKENPFERYYNDKINSNYLFSSFQINKFKVEEDVYLRNKIRHKLELINNFSKYLYNETGQNIFKVHNNIFPILRESILKRIGHTIKNIKMYTNESNQYFKLLICFRDIINNDKNIKNRSDFYSILKVDDLVKVFPHKMLQQLQIDIIDISYNSSFIQKGEIFRYKSISNIDNLYETFFDSYSNEGKLFKLYGLYKTFDTIKSKLEILELVTNPAKIIDYVASELMNTVEDKGVSVLHNVASYIIPKTKLIGIADSNNLLIGVK
ncbi:MAG: hypothetical protein PHF17_00835 [Arcobacteraceae bacterium]|nr:hypothetical protein [Arcobacteraceae bacterium]